jgi:hypothetical protein
VLLHAVTSLLASLAWHDVLVLCLAMAGSQDMFTCWGFQAAEMHTAHSNVVHMHVMFRVEHTITAAAGGLLLPGLVAVNWG